MIFADARQDDSVQHSVQFAAMPQTSTDNGVSSVEDLAGLQNSLMIHDVGILNSLSFPSMLDKQDDFEQRQEDACRWILDLDEYREWQSRFDGILWITGKSGAGKSTLMSFLSGSRCNNHVRTNTALPGTTKLRLYFFFKARGVDLQRHSVGMLRCLIYQLYRQDTEIQPLVIEKYKEKCRIFGQSSSNVWDWNRQELENLFAQALLVSLRCFDVEILIDALDEADPDSAIDVAQYFDSLYDNGATASEAMSASKLRICISSCGSLYQTLDRGKKVVLEQHNGKDIVCLVHNYLTCLRDTTPCISADDDLQGLEDLIVLRAQGNFQWIRLAVGIIRSCVNDAQPTDKIWQHLREMPPNLEEAYGFIIRNMLHPDQRSQSCLLFQWLCFAARQLSLAELRYALATDNNCQRSVEAENFTAHEPADHKQMSLQWSQSLYGLIEVEPRCPAHDATMHLSHSSIHRFLLAKGFDIFESLETDGNISSNKESLSEDVEKRGHSVLYWTCLKYLAAEDFQLVRRYCKSRSYSQLAARLPFLKYAITNILLHAERAAGARSTNLGSEKLLWQRILLDWCYIHRELYASSRTCPNSNTSILHVAASTGMTDLMKDLLKDGANVNAKDRQDCTPLYLASQRNHQASIQLLLDFEANVNIQTRPRGSTALQEAASQGSVETVRKLLEVGADMNIQGEKHSTALSAAVRNGHTDIVLMLLKAGADVNVNGKTYGTALQTASSCDRKEIAAILIDYGADVNSQGGRTGTALQAAAFGSGGDENCQLLLAAGADTNIRGGIHGTALQAASLRGKREMVNMLLAAGADVNIQAGRCGTALHAAIRKNKIEVVQVLIEHGADVNARGGIHDTPLQAAEVWAGDEIKQMLLNAGAVQKTSSEVHQRDQRENLPSKSISSGYRMTWTPSKQHSTIHRSKITSKLEGLIQKITRPKQYVPYPRSASPS